MELLSNIYNTHNDDVPQHNFIKIVLTKEEELTIKKKLLDGSSPGTTKSSK